MATTENTHHEEGPRAFSRFIELVGDGACHDKLSETLNELGAALLEDAKARQDVASGELTLKLAFKAEPNGVVSVGFEVKVKNPKPRNAGSVFWISKGGNLSVENPRQPQLPGIREVKTVIETKDLEGTSGRETARSV